MTEFSTFCIIGLGTGAMYALLAQGIVLIYRGSGVVNFAQGALALLGAIVFVESRDRMGTAGALVAAILAGAVAGLLIQGVVMARLGKSAPIVRVIATLGLMSAIQAGSALHYGSFGVPVAGYLTDAVWHFGEVSVQASRMLLLLISVCVTTALWLAQTRWLPAVATRAAAENDLAASTLGWSPQRLALGNWIAGGALAGAAGALIVPFTSLAVDNLTLLVVPALAAALLGRFEFVWGTLIGALGIGIAQAVIGGYWSQPGAVDAVPFLVIIVVLVVTGRALPLRSHVGDRLPSLGTGRPRPVLTIGAAAVVAVLMAEILNTTWLAAFTASLAVAVILLSVVVVTGYAGQISLAQYAIAGLGTFAASRLIADQGWPFWAACIAGVLTAIPVGVAFALPALRTRGVNLAVITLGLGVAVNAMLFSNPDYTGGIQGTQVGSFNLFGLDLNALDHPERYAIFVLIMFVLAAIAVTNLRRSIPGRRMIAMRENERAAAALGISVVHSKVYAFAFAAVLASLGGMLVGFVFPSILFTSYNPLSSVNAVTLTVIGGLGYVMGPVVGSTLAAGGIATLFNPLVPGIDEYVGLIGGIVVVVMLMLNPDGAVPKTASQIRRVSDRLQRFTRPLPGRAAKEDVPDAEVEGRTAVAPSSPRRGLAVRDVSVRFGPVTALAGFDLDVRPGEIVGLIGPNGAGKTTAIDAITGFVGCSSGEIALGDQVLQTRSADQRARAGVSRSWQSLELFEDVSVEENLQIAADASSHRWSDYLLCWIWPGRSTLTAPARAAVSDLELTDVLHRRPGDLSFGRRRLVSIARAIALDPSVLLLDEPAAGLSQDETQELGTILRRLAETWDIGIVLVEHDVNLVMAVSDRVVVLNFGRTVAVGSPAEVRGNPEVIDAYLGTEGPAEPAMPL